MEIIDTALGQGASEHGRSAQLCAVGPDGGRVALYFHSPATAGDELADAATAAEELGVRLLCLRRPTLEGDDPSCFVSEVASHVGAIVEQLGLQQFAVIAWSGGTPYALATAALLGPEVASVHLVSPLPGALTGPNAVPDQSERLQEIVGTDASSSWVSGAAGLRDYRAIVAPWTFAVESVTQPVTIWTATEDTTVPPRLADHLHQRLPNAHTVSVTGTHGWLKRNWHAVLSRVPR